MKHLSKEEVTGSYFWIWPLFCFQAGFINSGGFLACHRFVSHVTGFGTRIGMEFLQNNFLLGLEMLFIPIGFIFGCFISGYFNEVKDQRYNIPFYLISGILFIVTLLGQMDLFGPFGEPLVFQRDFLLLLLLCFTCGLQNGVLASITGGMIRTTHMTGVATDLGLSFARLLNRNNPGEKHLFKMRLFKITMFGSGAAAGTLFFNELHYLGFLIPGAMNVVLFIYLRLKLKAGLL